MTAIQVSAEQFKARLGQEQRIEVDAALARGCGMAKYSDASGAPRLLVSYGKQGADITGLPPRTFGQSDWEIVEHVAPMSVAATMRSPLLSHEQPRQIASPPRGQTRTQYPEVLLSGRTSPHPRGNAEFIEARTGREEPPPEVLTEAQGPPSEGAAWWASHLGR